jgi:hypothetical protein
VTDWSPDPNDPLGPWKRLEARRQNRIATFIRPLLQPDEQIVAILSVLFQRLSSGGASKPVAVVVTNQRLVVIRVGGMRKKVLVSYPRDGLKVEWSRNAAPIPGPYFRRAEEWAGKLTVSGSFSSTELWAGGWRQDPAETIAKMLEDDSRHG